MGPSAVGPSCSIRSPTSKPLLYHCLLIAPSPSPHLCCKAVGLCSLRPPSGPDSGPHRPPSCSEPAASLHGYHSKSPCVRWPKEPLISLLWPGTQPWAWSVNHLTEAGCRRHRCPTGHQLSVHSKEMRGHLCWLLATRPAWNSWGAGGSSRCRATSPSRSSPLLFCWGRMVTGNRRCSLNLGCVPGVV